MVRGDLRVKNIGMKKSKFGVKWIIIVPVQVSTTHALRHSHASLLIHLGENALIIRDRLGHASVDETLNTYSHLYSNANHKVADTLTNLLKQNM